MVVISQKGSSAIANARPQTILITASSARKQHFSSISVSTNSDRVNVGICGTNLCREFLALPRNADN